jgi:hypothetical protein
LSYPEIISLSGSRVKTRLVPQNFLITMVIPSLPQGCIPLTTIKMKVFNSILAQRGPDEAAERPPEWVGLLILLNIL